MKSTIFSPATALIAMIALPPASATALGLALALLAGPGPALRALPADPAAVLGVDSDRKPVRVADIRTRTRLDGVTFWPEADLTDADFTGKTLQGACLGGTDCRRARFLGVDLRRTTLRGARCAGADFTGALLDREDAEWLRGEGIGLAQAAGATQAPGPAPAPVAGAAPEPEGRAPEANPSGVQQRPVRRRGNRKPAVPPGGGPTRLSWEDHLALLKEYVNEHGNSQVPHRFKTEGGVNLGYWVSSQREIRKGTKKGSLPPERIKALEELPGWTWGAKPSSWEDHLALLKAYAAENGTARVPKSYKTKEGVALGRWICDQRRARVRKSPALTPERIKALEKFEDWTWQVGRGSDPERTHRKPARKERDGGPPVSGPGAAPPALPAWPAVKREPADPLPEPSVKLEPAAEEPAAPPQPDPDTLLGALPGPSWLHLRDFAATRNLDGVILVPGAPLRGADFQGRTLAQADLGEADCTGASFRDVDLRSTRLGQATLAGADFTGALLRPGDARDLQARGIDLGGARILEEPARGGKRKEMDEPGNGLPEAGRKE